MGLGWDFEAGASLDPLRLFDEPWPPADEPPALLPEFLIHPALAEEESREPGSQPDLLQGPAPEDPKVAGHDDPVAPPGQLRDPNLVRRIAPREFLHEVNNLVPVRLRERAQSPGLIRGQAVVQEKSHAASCSSYRTASRTARGSTMYQRATRSTDPSTWTALARMDVGTASGSMTGWPKEMAGSRTTRWLPDNG